MEEKLNNCRQSWRPGKYGGGKLVDILITSIKCYPNL
jgi:hypothetical protein